MPHLNSLERPLIIYLYIFIYLFIYYGDTVHLMVILLNPSWVELNWCWDLCVGVGVGRRGEQDTSIIADHFHNFLY